VPTGFDLRQNPFALLRVSARDPLSVLSEALAERQLEGVIDEQILLRAQQSLVNPRLRLDSEIRWLPGLDSRASRAVADQLGRSAKVGVDAVGSISGISLANVAAHEAAHDCRQNGSRRALYILLEAQGQISEDGLAATVNDDRLAAGFPAPDRRALIEALNRLRDEHADAAIASIQGQARGEAKAASLIMAELVGVFRSGQTPTRRLLDAINVVMDA
jgi:hypothetical protein